MQENPGKVITKYNFSPLLNEAWNKTMTPQVISNGFKRAGIYPFNPDIIDYGVFADLEEESLLPPPDTISSQKMHPAIFSSEQEQLFQKRFEEKYDLPDPVYQQWLRINHPTTEYVLENQPNDAADSVKEVFEFSLEQEQEEFENYEILDPVDQQSSSQERLQEDQVAEFSPEQELLFQKRFEENYNLPDPVYQQWLKINYPTAEQV